MSDESKAPKPKVLLGGEAPEEGARDAAAADAAHGAAAEKPAGADAAAERPEEPMGQRVGNWVSRAFPGHEHAFWGGVAGLAVAVLIFTVGIFQALVVALLVLAGVAAGQLADGDPKIINAVRRFFTGINN